MSAVHIIFLQRWSHAYITCHLCTHARARLVTIVLTCDPSRFEVYINDQERRCIKLYLGDLIMGPVHFDNETPAARRAIRH